MDCAADNPPCLHGEERHLPLDIYSSRSFPNSVLHTNYIVFISHIKVLSNKFVKELQREIENYFQKKFWNNIVSIRHAAPPAGAMGVVQTQTLAVKILLPKIASCETSRPYKASRMVSNESYHVSPSSVKIWFFYYLL